MMFVTLQNSNLTLLIMILITYRKQVIIEGVNLFLKINVVVGIVKKTFLSSISQPMLWHKSSRNLPHALIYSLLIFNSCPSVIFSLSKKLLGFNTPYQGQTFCLSDISLIIQINRAEEGQIHSPQFLALKSIQNLTIGGHSKYLWKTAPGEGGHTATHRAGGLYDLSHMPKKGFSMAVQGGGGAFFYFFLFDRYLVRV